MNDHFDRRYFLHRALSGAAGFGMVATGTLLASTRSTRPATHGVRQVRNYTTESDRPPMLVVAQGDPETATRKAIAALGGMKAFVRPGETVVIKPNVGWDRTPLQAANTNPVVVATLVRLCRKAGAKKVVVTDNTCNEASRCFTRSGIWKLAEQAGATIVLPAPHRFRTYDLGGAVLGEMPVLVPAVEADRFINVPVAKHHGLSGFTGAMKNLYGVLGGRRNRLHQDINRSIADLADFIRPTLTVMDATRVLFRSGPQGGSIADTKEVGHVVASTDQVAVDAHSCGYIGLSPADLPYLRLAEDRGLGTADIQRIPTKKV